MNNLTSFRKRPDYDTTLGKRQIQHNQSRKSGSYSTSFMKNLINPLSFPPVLVYKPIPSSSFTAAPLHHRRTGHNSVWHAWCSKDSFKIHFLFFNIPLQASLRHFIKMYDFSVFVDRKFKLYHLPLQRFLSKL